MRILIIGGTRFIGPAVVRRLDAMGHDVTVYHRGEHEAILPSGVDHWHGDRYDLPLLDDKLRRFLPDVVIDTAAYTQRDAEMVVVAMRGIARRLVVLSSQDVYRAYGRLLGKETGAPEPAPMSEDAPLRQRLFPYRGAGRGLDDYEKVLVERVVTSSPLLQGTVLRLPMVYGEGDPQRRIAIELRRMDDGRPAILLEETFARWRWTRGYVENVAHAVALAATDERARNRVYNVGDEGLTYADWVRELAGAAGWQGDLVIVPDGTLPLELRPPPGDYTQHLAVDASRIRSELGYEEPVARRDALRLTVEWERTHRTGGDARPRTYDLEDGLLRQRRASPTLERPPTEATEPRS